MPASKRAEPAQRAPRAAPLEAHPVIASGATAADPHRVERSDKAALLQRLRRIEGQVRGVAQMIESDRYCIDVLTQLAAIRSALDAAALGLTEDHVHHCVAAAIAGGHGTEAIDELMKVLRRFAR